LRRTSLKRKKRKKKKRGRRERKNDLVIDSMKPLCITLGFARF